MNERRPYAEAAQGYWRAGWANPLPCKGKAPVPEGYTGYDGRNVSWPDLQRWTIGPEGGQNVALRLPGDVIGIDVDAHDGKGGGDTITRAEMALGTLPPTIRSTARPPWEASGIRFYRVPPGTDLRGAEKRLRSVYGEGVDIIRRDHRYAVVWPSVHPETGTVYTWYWPDGSEEGQAHHAPHPSDLAELPSIWLDFLTAGAEVATTPVGPTPTPVVRTAEEGALWHTTTFREEMARRPFTRGQAAAFVRPYMEALRSAQTGSINNRLNEAGIVLAHFVPRFWSRADAERWLLDAVNQTAYDGKTWRAERTIASALDAPTWLAELVEESEADAGTPASPVAPTLRRGEFTGVRERQRAEPAFFRRADGQALLYPGKDSYLYAETESGKSWLTVLGVAQCIGAGVPVMVVDFEEGDEIEYGLRLLALGMTEDKLNDPTRFRYLMADGRCAADVMAEADDMGAAVVVYEGMSVAYDLFGWQVKENDSATAFRRTLVKPHLVAGRAVLTTDHVVKDRDNRGRYAIGGVMKLNAASGGAFLLVNVEGLAPGQRGASNLYVTKDRPGGVKRHGVPAGERWDPQVKRVGTLVVDDTRVFVNYTDVSILPPAPDEAAAVVCRPSLTEEVLAAVERIIGAGRAPSMNAIRSECSARDSEIDAELERLTTRGVLVESRGARGARLFRPSAPRPEAQDD